MRYNQRCQSICLMHRELGLCKTWFATGCRSVASDLKDSDERPRRFSPLRINKLQFTPHTLTDLGKWSMFKNSRADRESPYLHEQKKTAPLHFTFLVMVFKTKQKDINWPRIVTGFLHILDFETLWWNKIRKGFLQGPVAMVTDDKFAKWTFQAHLNANCKW